MSQPSTTPVRPSQVTVAAWMIMVGSVFVVLLVWDRIAGLHSLESRRALQSALDRPGIKGTGLGVSDLMLAVQVVSMIGAGCATAMVILGYQALHRSRSARLALTVLAVPLFLTGLVTGRFVSFGVAAAVVTLWLGPARAWFDGRNPATAARVAWPSLPGHTGPPDRTRPGPAPGTHPSSTGLDPAPPAAPSAPDPEVWAPPPTSAYDARPTTGFGATPVSWPVPTSAARPGAGPGARPPTVMWACVLTWIFSGFTALLLVASMVFLASNSALVLRRMHEQNPALAQQGMSDHTILVVCYVFCSLCVLWCVAATACAVLVFRRVRWSWFALLISTIGVGALCLLGVLGSLVTAVPLVAAGATVALLLRPESRRWIG